MSKLELAFEVIKQLMKCVLDLKTLADSVEGLCTTLTDGLQNVVSKEKEEPKPVKAKEPKISLEKVRGFLAEKSREGYATEVREIIANHGANRLSDIDPEEYAAILEEAEELGNAG